MSLTSYRAAPPRDKRCLDGLGPLNGNAAAMGFIGAALKRFVIRDEGYP